MKVQCQEGAMVGVHKCRIFEGSADAKVKCQEGDDGRPQVQEV